MLLVVSRQPASESPDVCRLLGNTTYLLSLNPQALAPMPVFLSKLFRKESWQTTGLGHNDSRPRSLDLLPKFWRTLSPDCLDVTILEPQNLKSCYRDSFISSAWHIRNSLWMVPDRMCEWTIRKSHVEGMWLDRRNSKQMEANGEIIHLNTEITKHGFGVSFYLADITVINTFPSVYSTLCKWN